MKPGRCLHCWWVVGEPMKSIRFMNISDTPRPLPPGTVACEYCGLLQEQADGIEPGAFNDMGWWCRDCINRGHRRTEAQMEWELFASDYPQFALELKRLRKQLSTCK